MKIIPHSAKNKLYHFVGISVTHMRKREREREHFHIHPIFHFNLPLTIVMMRKLYTTNYVGKG